MSQESHNPKRTPLVSVEFQTEINVATGAAERRMFVKMYFDARDSGLLAAIGDRRWRTLCALATYMDENGNCFPSQEIIARDLGISRQRVNERIQELLAFRFHDEPVLTVSKTRTHTNQGSRWGNNVYQLRPITGFSFGKPKSDTADPYVRKSGHRPMSGKPDTGNPDTNKSQGINKNVNVNAGQKTLEKKREDTPPTSTRRQRWNLTEDQLTQAHGMALEAVDQIGQSGNLRAYFTLAAEAIEAGNSQAFFSALSETKERGRDGTIRTTPSQYFHAAFRRRVPKRPRPSSGETQDSPQEITRQREEARAAMRHFLKGTAFPDENEADQKPTRQRSAR
jgi:hypothetical protein